MPLTVEEQAAVTFYDNEAARRDLAHSMDNLGWSLRELSTTVDVFTPIERMQLTKLLSPVTTLLLDVARRRTNP